MLYVRSCGELTTKQLLEVVVPVSTPPLTRMPFASRALAWKPRKLLTYFWSPKARRLRHQVLDVAEERWADVVEAAQLLAAAAGQRRIDRRRHAVRAVGRRRRVLFWVTLMLWSAL